MVKKNAKREEQWAEAKRRCRLSAEQLRRAREMGRNPLSLLKNIPAPGQQWKQPVGDWVDRMYEKRQANAARKKAKRDKKEKAMSAEPTPAPKEQGKNPDRLSVKPPTRRAGKRKPSRDSFQYRIQVAADIPLGSVDDDSHLVKYVVTLLGNENDEDADPHYIRIGDLRVWMFLIGAYRGKAGFPLFDLFDADSEEAMQLYHAVFDSDSEEPLASLAAEGLIDDTPIGSDLLHFQWGDLPAEYRRSDVVLAMVERTLDVLGGGCFAATLWPWDAPAPDPNTNSSADVMAFFDSQQANEDHWGKIGFKRITGTAILIRDLAGYDWPV